MLYRHTRRTFFTLLLIGMFASTAADEAEIYRIRPEHGHDLSIANERNAYTLTDRGTYLALRKRLNLPILVEGDKLLAISCY